MNLLQWLPWTLDLSAHWYLPVQLAFDWRNFSAAFSEKWDYLGIQFLWRKFSHFFFLFSWWYRFLWEDKLPVWPTDTDCSLSRLLLNLGNTCAAGISLLTRLTSDSPDGPVIASVMDAWLCSSFCHPTLLWYACSLPLPGWFDVWLSSLLSRSWRIWTTSFTETEPAML